MSDLAPIWFLDRGTTFFAGTLDYNAPHQHGAPVYLAGLEGSFGIRLPGTPWLTCRAAMIPAGVVHELDVGGQPIAVIYTEGAEGSPFMAMAVGHEEVGGSLLGSTCDTTLLCSLFEDPQSIDWIGEGLSDLLQFASNRSERSGRLRQIDGRLRHALELFLEFGVSDTEAVDAPDELPCLAAVAARAGLSPSRFQHVFTTQMGVPFRRYRCWIRMRRAIRAIAAGSNFTRAAHAAGYADQAHFAHDFRRTFGAPASRSLKGLRV